MNNIRRHIHADFWDEFGPHAYGVFQPRLLIDARNPFEDLSDFTPKNICILGNENISLTVRKVFIDAVFFWNNEYRF